MERQEIIDALKGYFGIGELVCDHIHGRWGEHSWQFLDTDYLHCLLVLRRDVLRAGMACNHGEHHQRGMRCNRCELVRTKDRPYISAHVLGKAGDFTVEGMTAEQARGLVKANAGKFPCRVRIEGGVSWLHFDVIDQVGVAERVYEFRV